MNININTLAKDIVSFIKEGTDPNWNAQPLFLNKAKSAILSELEINVDWFSSDANGNPASFTNMLKSDTSLKDVIAKSLTLGIGQCLIANQSPEVNAITVMIGSGFKAVLANSLKGAMDRDAMADIGLNSEMDTIYQEYYAISKEFIDSINANGYDVAINIHSDFVSKLANKRFNQHVSDNIITGALLLSDEFDPEMDISEAAHDLEVGDTSTEVDDDITIGELDNVLDPKDPDVRAVAQAEQEEIENILTRKASVRRHNIKESRRLEQAAKESAPKTPGYYKDFKIVRK